MKSNSRLFREKRFVARRTSFCGKMANWPPKKVGHLGLTVSRKEPSFAAVLAAFLLDDVHPFAAAIEDDLAGREREERMVAADADVSPRRVARASLANDNAAGDDFLAAINLDAQPLGVGIAAVL